MDSLTDDLRAIHLTNDSPSISGMQWDTEALPVLMMKVPWIVQCLQSDHQFMLVCDMAERFLRQWGTPQTRLAYMIQRDEEGPLIACINVVLHTYQQFEMKNKSFMDDDSCYWHRLSINHI